MAMVGTAARKVVCYPIGDIDEDEQRLDWRDIPGLIRDADGVWECPRVDRDPLPRWRYGRVSLLGDAAHAVYPIGSNGATQAILDGRVPVREMLRHGQAAAALVACDIAGDEPGGTGRGGRRLQDDRRVRPGATECPAWADAFVTRARPTRC